MPILTPTPQGEAFEREHIPAGVYSAVLIAIDVFQMNDDKRPGQKKDMLRWTFSITSKKTGVIKDFEGVSSTAWGPGDPTQGMVPKAWRWSKVILGEDPPLEQFNTDDLAGAVCQIKVSDKTDKKTGALYSFVEDVVPPAGDF